MRAGFERLTAALDEMAKAEGAEAMKAAAEAARKIAGVYLVVGLIRGAGPAGAAALTLRRIP